MRLQPNCHGRFINFARRVNFLVFFSAFFVYLHISLCSVSFDLLWPIAIEFTMSAVNLSRYITAVLGVSVR